MNEKCEKHGCWLVYDPKEQKAPPRCPECMRETIEALFRNNPIVGGTNE